VTLGILLTVVVGLVVVAGTVWELKRPKQVRKFRQPGLDADLAPADARLAELRRRDSAGQRPPRSKPRRADGMTWTALAILVFLLALSAGQAWVWVDSRQVPESARAVTAEVTGLHGTGERAESTPSPDHQSIAFTTADGETGSALYEKRWIGSHEAGDTITVYQDEDGAWVTTAEKSVGGLVGIAIGFLLFLAMVVGWVVVRRRKEQALPGTVVRRDGPQGI
jgi:hypothetical protein